MRFEARELKEYAEPVAFEDLNAGAVYFSVQFLDEEMLIPVVEPYIYLGKDLFTGDLNRYYFETFEAYSSGIRYESARQDQLDCFQVTSKGEFSHLFEYERALDVLMTCALKRREAGSNAT